MRTFTLTRFGVKIKDGGKTIPIVFTSVTDSNSKLKIINDALDKKLSEDEITRLLRFLGTSK